MQGGLTELGYSLRDGLSLDRMVGRREGGMTGGRDGGKKFWRANVVVTRSLNKNIKKKVWREGELAGSLASVNVWANRILHT